nr:immunoglobulin heavy chain junction region [Macaca mulatta]MOV48669.1 immunoglobulin heavy chain junction region [Macaca mulatta]MOV48696.1 immunoglobulin heavy chain junction region [Macaca mulatta]MOV52899.1 immunoglobulin heavy chain junction region [Macaca mulatta]
CASEQLQLGFEYW